MKKIITWCVLVSFLFNMFPPLYAEESQRLDLNKFETKLDGSFVPSQERIDKFNANYNALNDVFKALGVANFRGYTLDKYINYFINAQKTKVAPALSTYKLGITDLKNIAKSRAEEGTRLYQEAAARYDSQGMERAERMGGGPGVLPDFFIGEDSYYFNGMLFKENEFYERMKSEAITLEELIDYIDFPYTKSVGSEMPLIAAEMIFNTLAAQKDISKMDKDTLASLKEILPFISYRLARKLYELETQEPRTGLDGLLDLQLVGTLRLTMLEIQDFYRRAETPFPFPTEGHSADYYKQEFNISGACEFLTPDEYDKRAKQLEREARNPKVTITRTKGLDGDYRITMKTTPSKVTQIAKLPEGSVVVDANEARQIQKNKTSGSLYGVTLGNPDLKHHVLDMKSISSKSVSEMKRLKEKLDQKEEGKRKDTMEYGQLTVMTEFAVASAVKQFDWKSVEEMMKMFDVGESGTKRGDKFYGDFHNDYDALLSATYAAIASQVRSAERQDVKKYLVNLLIAQTKESNSITSRILALEALSTLVEDFEFSEDEKRLIASRIGQFYATVTCNASTSEGHKTTMYGFRDFGLESDEVDKLADKLGEMFLRFYPDAAPGRNVGGRAPILDELNLPSHVECVSSTNYNSSLHHAEATTELVFFGLETLLWAEVGGPLFKILGKTFRYAGGAMASLPRAVRTGRTAYKEAQVVAKVEQAVNAGTKAEQTAAKVGNAAGRTGRAADIGGSASSKVGNAAGRTGRTADIAGSASSKVGDAAATGRKVEQGAAAGRKVEQGVNAGQKAANAGTAASKGALPSVTNTAVDNVTATGAKAATNSSTSPVKAFWKAFSEEVSSGAKGGNAFKELKNNFVEVIVTGTGKDGEAIAMHVTSMSELRKAAEVGEKIVFRQTLADGSVKMFAMEGVPSNLSEMGRAIQTAFAPAGAADEAALVALSRGEQYAVAERLRTEKQIAEQLKNGEVDIWVSGKDGVYRHMSSLEGMPGGVLGEDFSVMVTPKISTTGKIINTFTRGEMLENGAIEVTSELMEKITISGDAPAVMTREIFNQNYIQTPNILGPFREMAPAWLKRGGTIWEQYIPLTRPVSSSVSSMFKWFVGFEVADRAATVGLNNYVANIAQQDMKKAMAPYSYFNGQKQIPEELTQNQPPSMTLLNDLAGVQETTKGGLIMLPVLWVGRNMGAYDDLVGINTKTQLFLANNNMERVELILQQRDIKSDDAVAKMQQNATKGLADLEKGLDNAVAQEKELFSNPVLQNIFQVTGMDINVLKGPFEELKREATSLRQEIKQLENEINALKAVHSSDQKLIEEFTQKVEGLQKRITSLSDRTKKTLESCGKKVEKIMAPVNEKYVTQVNAASQEGIAICQQSIESILNSRIPLIYSDFEMPTDGSSYYEKFEKRMNLINGYYAEFENNINPLKDELARLQKDQEALTAKVNANPGNKALQEQVGKTSMRIQEIYNKIVKEGEALAKKIEPLLPKQGTN